MQAPPPLLKPRPSFVPLFTQFPAIGVLGSCASPCNPSYLTSLINTAGLTSLALSWRGGEASMKRIIVLLTVALLMAAMLAASAIPAMAFNEAACNQGTTNAHNSAVPEGNPAHDNIPMCV